MKYSTHKPGLSRADSHQPRAMARPIQQKGKRELTARFSVDSLKSLPNYVRRHIRLLFLSVFVLTVIFCIFFTRLSALKTVLVSIDERAGCLSKQYVEQYVLNRMPSIWSPIFFSQDELLRMHPCLEKFVVKWNPFSPTIVRVTVVAYKPVLQVELEAVAPAEVFGTAESFFKASPVSHDSRFMLNDGSLVELDANPKTPIVSLRHFSNVAIDKIRFSKEEITMVLQIISFCEQKLGFSPRLVISDSGVVSFTSVSSYTVYMTLHKDIALQLGSLQAILSTSTIDKSKLELIDIRSGNVVIRSRK